ncbi:hypothetical protein VHUM_02280 [Vanrija humicola]|uniref:Small RNA 2'-O-methyltransferase n=1 Tax=Vanrija humicola TaxID=5417 RepID=A0A7D8YZ97_VANHU|nr:hypothetical protein VHUM_02280 [Vanrija humicola]
MAAVTAVLDNGVPLADKGSAAATAAAAAHHSTPAPPASPPPLSPSALPTNVPAPEVSMVEASDFTGVTFTPELWMQRRSWALDVLRTEGARSIVDFGCGPGSLLQTAVIPPSTVPEKPIIGPNGDIPDGISLYTQRLAAVDVSAEVMTTAMSQLEPPGPNASGVLAPPRWAPMSTELWLGSIEHYNSRLEGYDSIVALEVIEHLEPNLLSRFGVVTLGTYRPRLLLLTTPNFDFNAKFPSSHSHDDENCDRRGFVDPTGRTDRVFRHSDHKCEMTGDEFRHWALAAADDWGYDVEIGGVGISSKPSYYPAKNGERPKPIYATHTAVFRRTTGIPMRSPRSVRTVELPFMIGVNEAAHPHRLVGRWYHPVTAVTQPGAPKPPAALREVVGSVFDALAQQQLSLDELWAYPEVSGASAGSKRHLVSALGGWGNCPPIPGSNSQFAVVVDHNGLAIKRN